MAKAKPTPPNSEGVTPPGDASTTVPQGGAVTTEGGSDAALRTNAMVRVWRRVGDQAEVAVDLDASSAMQGAHAGEREAAAFAAGVAIADVFAWSISDQGVTVVTTAGQKIRVRSNG